MIEGYWIVFAVGLGLIAFLLWMLFPVDGDFVEKEEKEKPKGFCPMCSHPLMKGERIRSDQTEIGNVEVQTWIKGCPYCIGPSTKMKRLCPVCKKKVAKDEVVLASSDPRVNRLKLSIRGCKSCWPQGFGLGQVIKH